VEGFATPLRDLAGSPTEFFRTSAVQKTTDETVAFLVWAVAALWVALNCSDISDRGKRRLTTGERQSTDE